MVKTIDYWLNFFLKMLKLLIKDLTKTVPSNIENISIFVVLNINK